METRVFIDEKYRQPRAEIYASAYSLEVRRAAAILEGSKEPLILEKDGSFRLFEQEEAECFYTNGGGRVEARMKNGEVFFCRERIFELEEKLKGNFVKINQGAIANLDCAERFSVLFNGTMEVLFFSGNKEYVSRRTGGKIKAILGMRYKKRAAKDEKTKSENNGRY